MVSGNQQTFCALCSGDRLEILQESANLCAGVTSDSKPWPRFGSLAVCEDCGHVQQVMDEMWRRDVGEIYASYCVHPAQGGEEQQLFAGDGQARSRALAVARALADLCGLGPEGSILDVGCGTGSFLMRFAELRPSWRLFGQEIGQQYENSYSLAPCVERCYATLEQCDRQFDLITMNDVLEHLPTPRATLETLRQLLKPNGLLFARSPLFTVNPFDLGIFDHCSHFLPATLHWLLAHAGLVPVPLAGRPWLGKEIGFVARAASALPSSETATAVRQARQTATQGLAWLGKIPGIFAGPERPDGIYGTSVAATLSYGLSGAHCDFFVDEDEHRQAVPHLGRQVIRPEDIAPGARVFLAFPAEQVRSLRGRLEAARPDVRFIAVDD
jgi:SAM-dependent methyltransferase